MFEDLVACGICFEKYSANTEHIPKMLSCHHSFCCLCLQHMVAVSSYVNKILCPICRSETQFRTAGGISSLPNNIYALKLLDAISNETSTASHDQCTLHPEEKYEKFCETCRESFCWKCVLNHDASHNVTSIEKVARRDRAQIRDISTFLEGKLKYLEENLDRNAQHMNSLNEKRSRIQQQVHSTFENLSNLLKIREEELNKSVDYHFHKKQIRLSHIHDTNIETGTTLKKILEHSRRCLTDYSYSNLIKNSAEIKEQMKYIINKNTNNELNNDSTSISTPIYSLKIPIESNDNDEIIFLPILDQIIYEMIENIGLIYDEKSLSDTSNSNIFIYIQSYISSLCKSITNIKEINSFIINIYDINYWNSKFNCNISPVLHFISNIMTNISSKISYASSYLYHKWLHMNRLCSNSIPGTQIIQVYSTVHENYGQLQTYCMRNIALYGILQPYQRVAIAIVNGVRIVAHCQSVCRVGLTSIWKHIVVLINLDVLQNSHNPNTYNTKNARNDSNEHSNGDDGQVVEDGLENERNDDEIVEDESVGEHKVAEE